MSSSNIHTSTILQLSLSLIQRLMHYYDENQFVGEDCEKISWEKLLLLATLCAISHVYEYCNACVSAATRVHCQHQYAVCTVVWKWLLKTEEVRGNKYVSIERAHGAQCFLWCLPCTTLSAHASLSLCDHWQRLQDTKLAAKLFLPSISPLPPSARGPRAPRADKAACCLANCLLWVFPSSPELLILLFYCCCVTSQILTPVVCVYWFKFFFICLCCLLLSLHSLSDSLPRLFPGEKN